MNSFKTIYNKHLSQLLREADGDENVEEVPQDANAEADLQPQVPSEEEVVAEEPQPDVTSEGKKFMIELALKALAIDPDSIPASDKDIFNNTITGENADLILQRLQNLVDTFK